MPAYDVAVEITNLDNVKTFYLYDIMVQNDAIQMAINPGDRVFFRPLRDNEILKTVKVSGYVNKPGVYAFVEGKKLTDMIDTAGGLSKEADLRGIVFKRAKLTQQGKEMIWDKNQKDIKLIQGMMANDTNATKDDIESRKASLEEIEQEGKNLNSKSFGRIALDIKSNDLSKLDDTENTGLS